MPPAARLRKHSYIRRNAVFRPSRASSAASGAVQVLCTVPRLKHAKGAFWRVWLACLFFACVRHGSGCPFPGLWRAFRACLARRPYFSPVHRWRPGKWSFCPSGGHVSGGRVPGPALLPAGTPSARAGGNRPAGKERLRPGNAVTPVRPEKNKKDLR